MDLDPRIPFPKAAWLNLGLLGSLWLLLFWHLHYEWEYNLQYSYGYFAVFLWGYLIYLRWQDSPPVTPSDWPTKRALRALLLGATALAYPVSIIFAANVDWRLIVWMEAGALFVLSFLMLRYWGGPLWQRHFIWPLIFVLTLIPWPHRIEIIFVQHLMYIVSAWVVDVLNLMGIYAFRQGAVLSLKSGVVTVAEACSGVRSFQSTLMAGLFFGELLRFSKMRRVALIVFACLCAFGFNVARTTFLAWVAASWGFSALEHWHDSAGYTVFAASTATLILITWLLSGKHLSPNAPIKQPVQQYHWLGIKLCCAVMVLLALSWPCANVWYLWRSSCEPHQRNWQVDWPISAPQFSLREPPEILREMIFYHKGQLVEWKTPTGESWIAYLLEWDNGYAAQVGGFHDPRNCMPAQGWVTTGTYTPYVFTLGDEEKPSATLIFNVFSFDSEAGERVYVFSCQWDPLGYRYDLRIGRMRIQRWVDVWTGNRRWGKKVFQGVGIAYPSEALARASFESFLKKCVHLTEEI